MKKMIMFLMLFAIGIFSILLITPFVSAHCPLCTAGAVVGVGVTRSLGIDDSIVGLFIGAVIISTALWFNKWLLKKKIRIPFQETIMVIISFLLFAIPFYKIGIITNFEMVKSMPEQHAMTGLGIFGLGQFGIDKLLFGIIVGSIVLWLVFSLSDYIKKKKGKTLYKYQGISFMLITLAILSLIFWLITK